MRRITFFSAISVMLIISGCKKDQLPDSGGTTLDQVIQTSKTGDLMNTTKYEYNSQGKLIKITSTPSGSSTIHSTAFEYDTQGKVVKYTVSNTAAGIICSYTFIYDLNNRIVRSIGSPVLANLSLDNYTFTYDSQNRIIADSTYNSYNVLTVYHTYAYNDKDNIVATELFQKLSGSFSSDGKITIAYDDKPNPRRFVGNTLYFGGFSFSNLSQNNIVSQTPAYGAAALVYQYYKNGLLKSQTSSSLSYQFEFLYK